MENRTLERLRTRLKTRLGDGFSLERATNSILVLKKDIGKGLIALGEWILLTKENIPTAEWQEWLRNEVHVSERTAYRYMEIAQKIDYQTLERLGPSKVYEILDAPKEKQKEILEKAEGKSVRQVRKMVQEAKAELEPKPHEEFPDLTPTLQDISEKVIVSVEAVTDLLKHADYSETPTNWKAYMGSRVRLMVRTLQDLEKELQ